MSALKKIITSEPDKYFGDKLPQISETKIELGNITQSPSRYQDIVRALSYIHMVKCYKYPILCGRGQYTTGLLVLGIDYDIGMFRTSLLRLVKSIELDLIDWKGSKRAIQSKEHLSNLVAKERSRMISQVLTWAKLLIKNYCAPQDDSVRLSISIQSTIYFKTLKHRSLKKELRYNGSRTSL